MNESILQVGRNAVKRALKQKLKNLVKRKILLNPFFVGTLLIFSGVILFFILISAAMSSVTSVASEVIITEKIQTPQIYYKGLEKLITSGFGPRIHPVTGKKSVHNGIDIGIGMRTPVASSFAGTVTTVNYPQQTDSESTQSAGIYVAVKASDKDQGLNARYMHLDEVFVVPGQTVKEGQIIGLSGNTGRSTGPHLHFETKPEGEGLEPIDPTPFVMMMSILVDYASDEAFKAMRQVDFIAETGEYVSDKMLYVSNVYLETKGPAFSPTGSTVIRNLNTGLSNTYPGAGSGTGTGGGTTITVPPTNGNRTSPFITKFAPAAMDAERRTGVPASISLAQAALESGWGQSPICNNVFGIKASPGWRGPTCSSLTLEYIGGEYVPIIANFRSYTSFEASFEDHGKFLLENPRYHLALATDNPFIFANELQRAGYATDWQYANKLKSIIRNYNLVQYDINKGVDPSTGQSFEDVTYGSVPTEPGSNPGGSSGSSGGNSGSGTREPNEGDTITIFFGISQVYGTPAQEVHRETITTTDADGNPVTREVITYTPITDPEKGNPVINLVNYNNVLKYFSGRETLAPEIYVKEVPDAIAVTLVSGKKEDLKVTNVEYIKGAY